MSTVSRGFRGRGNVSALGRRRARAALTHRVSPGCLGHHLAGLIVELDDPWTAAHQDALHQRRGHPRRRGAGAGPPTRLVFANRVPVAAAAWSSAGPALPAPPGMPRLHDQVVRGCPHVGQHGLGDI
jgi:hypothetical protein